MESSRYFRECFMFPDRYYCAARAAEERNLANASADPKVRQIHLQMVSLYERRIKSAG
jgi:hypothetical protein